MGGTSLPEGSTDLSEHCPVYEQASHWGQRCLLQHTRRHEHIHAPPRGWAARDGGLGRGGGERWEGGRWTGNDGRSLARRECEPFMT
eukprot:366339-Chlamydomonas_euryale.AAC.1